MKKMYFCIAFAFLFISLDDTIAQTQQQCSPNCGDLNAGIQYDPQRREFHAKIYWTDIISNFDCAAPVEFVVYSKSGSPIHSGSSDDVGNEQYFLISDACALDPEEGVRISITNDLGGCWSNVTFKRGHPVMSGRRTTVYCDHPMVDDPTILINGSAPVVSVSCVGLTEPTFVADWIFPRECDPGVQDTTKRILREWEYIGKEDHRVATYDTIDVLLFPEIDANHIYCEDKDTVYCGEPLDSIGPYITIDSLGTGVCDTIYLIDASISEVDDKLTFEPASFQSKCGLAVHLDYELFESSCEDIYKITVFVKQNCFGPAQSTCVVNPPAGTAPNTAEQLAPGYWKCTFWLTDLDTVPPLTSCKLDGINQDHVFLSYDDPALGYDPDYHCFDTTRGAPIIVVPTGTHDCSGDSYLPPLCVYDDWSGVKQVKATVFGLGTYVLSTSEDTCYFEVDGEKVVGQCFESHESIRIPKSEVPYQILYEAIDSCHNVDSSYCYLYVKDLTKPVPVVDKGVTVSLSGKKTWVNANTFDEGSLDNCGVNLILARRQDWYTACVDLCDSTAVCCITDHHDTLRIPLLETDKNINEVEAHYAKTIEWLREDGRECGSILYNAWQYDLMKYATLECVDHPYAVDDNYFRERFLECYGEYLYGNEDAKILEIEGESCFSNWLHVDPTFNPGCEPHPGLSQPALHGTGAYNALSDDELALINMYSSIGGGWAEDVPFSCEDACGPVTVEVLVMDYWCNWATAWTKVWVEDKTPVSVAQNLVDQRITCKVYNQRNYDLAGSEHSVSLSEIVEFAKLGNEEALDALDNVFGGFQKVWKDSYGNHVDIDGNVIETEIPFYDSICRCTSDVESRRVYDDHLGYVWVDSLITHCYYEPDTAYFQHGLLEVNCAQNVQCEQEVWCEFDHCGEGYIYRKFKMWQSCPDTFYTSKMVPDSLKHSVDTIVRHQVIYVGNECELNKFMFDVPGDLTVYSCGIDYDSEGSGNVVGAAGPENTGYATYKFDDGCRLVGIGHEDKVFSIVGGDEGCYKIERTWYFADWCTDGVSEENDWWLDETTLIGSCVQKILVVDTVGPVCTIDGPVAHGGTFEVSACDVILSVNVGAIDECAVTGYYWELRDEEGMVVDESSGSLEGDSVHFTIESDTISIGSYSLKVSVTDDCNNESTCEYDINIVSIKKPTPICISTITADLTPWDSDNDGEVDSAHAIIWASEFDQSSQAPCGISDDSLRFYVELLTGDDQDLFDVDRVSNNLVVTCADLGTKLVRMWVVDPLGAADYCDVLLVVQDNADVCGFDNTNMASLVGQIEDEAGAKVEKVQVMAESNQALNSIKSGEDGSFEFEVAMGASVVLTPFKNINPLNGITTNDLVLMLNHISGSDPIQSSYRRLGADVNRDGAINALDLLDLRKLILGEIDRLSESDSWRFVTKEYVFGDTPESEDVPSKLNIEMTDANVSGDFIGVKMGDLDMDNDPVNRAPRSSEVLVFTTEDRRLEAGHHYSVPITTTRFDSQTGYQYTMQFDTRAVRVSDIKVGELAYLDKSNFGVRYLQDGKLTTSWNATSEGLDVQWGQTIFTVDIVAKENTRLSDVMAITSNITRAESYKNGSVSGVALEFDAFVESDEAILYQNIPNPVGEHTSIQFYLPAGEDIKLFISDITGKIIKRYDGFYGAGKHILSLEKADLPPSEVYFYTMIADDKSMTKKMVFIR